MKYKTIQELDNRIEKIIKKNVEAYYTDWKHYDRPKYMAFKGSSDRADRVLILIARRCDTYLIKAADIGRQDWSTTVFDYYNGNGGGTDNDYYEINLDRLTINRIEPTTYGRELKKVNKAA